MKEKFKYVTRRYLMQLAAVFASFAIVLSGCSGKDVSSENNITAESTVSQTESANAQQTDDKAGQGTGASFDISSVPAYSGSPYVEINNNVPEFADSDKTQTAFETYSDLDSLGRCQTAYANVCKEIMPTQERGKIGEIKPSGWHTVKYDGIDGNYLYNRCHLIAYQLAGENANEKNLITGTRYLNVQGMLPFEDKVADYVNQTDNHVLYRVTPVFEGNNLVASGVHMEAYSVEDSGKGICFNIYAYNIQPGIKINYSTGDSEADSSNTQAESKAAGNTESNTQNSPQTGTPGTADHSSDSGIDNSSSQNSQEEYIMNTNTHKFHKPGCQSVKTMKDKNKKVYKGNRQDLINQGYQPCKNCNP